MTFAEAVPHCIVLGKKVKCALWVDGEGEFNYYMMWDTERFSFAKHFVMIDPYIKNFFPDAECFTEVHPQTYWFPSKKEMMSDWEVIE